MPCLEWSDIVRCVEMSVLDLERAQSVSRIASFALKQNRVRMGNQQGTSLESLSDTSNGNITVRLRNGKTMELSEMAAAHFSFFDPVGRPLKRAASDGFFRSRRLSAYLCVMGR